MCLQDLAKCRYLYTYQWSNLVSRFKETRGNVWDGPRNFESWSDDEDYISASSFCMIRRADLTGTWPTNTAYRVSNLEPSGYEAETLPLVHHGSYSAMEV
ncbi:hypothetical protein AVEN_1510-1 [Araneus ventricosus]|uniref:Uncharacterized protein n=1 Tax=Araneus ventricosus TaxID=182803 RepID=A0A4Y2GHB1_ARAVE|nr:hypothetical protein AVEN_1510-1 [Araneus ventricosus]